MFFLLRQPVASNEITLTKFANPAKVGLEQGGGLVNLVTVERHCGLQPQGVPRREPTRQHAAGSAKISRVEKLFPQTFSLLRRSIDFKTIFASVAGPRDDGGNAVNPPVFEVVILNLFERHVR